MKKNKRHYPKDILEFVETKTVKTEVDTGTKLNKLQKC